MPLSLSLSLSLSLLSPWADLIFFVFLPPLLFEDAFGTDFFVFRKIMWSAVLLALPGVVFAIASTAALIYLIFPVMGAQLNYHHYFGWKVSTFLLKACH